VAEVEPYWKSLWGEKVQQSEGAEWIRREERRKIIFILYKIYIIMNF
jgi:hypothetical protein